MFSRYRLGMKKLLWFVFVLSVLPAMSEVEKFEHLGKIFRVFRAQPEEVRLVWAGKDAQPLFTFKAAYQRLTSEEGKVMMLTNGGIFEPRQIPSGFYVEKGEVKHPINLKAGKGNFFLKPNGVFYVKKEGEKFSAGVIESGALAKWSDAERNSLWYAVQSGPSLLLNGKKHPAFNRPSKSELLRNGVGVTSEGEVVFVITERGSDVNLWTFADCFRALGCADALFLDGDISQMKVNPTADVKGHGFATMFGVVRLSDHE